MAFKFLDRLLGIGRVPLMPMDEVEHNEQIADLEVELDGARAALAVESDVNDQLAKELFEVEEALLDYDHLNPIKSSTATIVKRVRAKRAEVEAHKARR